MTDFSIETLDKILTHPNINVKPSIPRDAHFDRFRYFTLDGTEYVIEWWVNICYLNIGGVIIPFNSVQQSGTWPNRAKLNLQFYDKQSNICCVIPLEKYPDHALTGSSTRHSRPPVTTA